jgi:hypothetical protein
VIIPLNVPAKPIIGITTRADDPDRGINFQGFCDNSVLDSFFDITSDTAHPIAIAAIHTQAIETVEYDSLR